MCQWSADKLGTRSVELTQRLVLQAVQKLISDINLLSKHHPITLYWVLYPRYPASPPKFTPEIHSRNAHYQYSFCQLCGMLCIGVRVHYAVPGTAMPYYSGADHSLLSYALSGTDFRIMLPGFGTERCMLLRNPGLYGLEGRNFLRLPPPASVLWYCA